MLPDVDSCYRALSARDRRFDGVFFVGVTTTGIYCRPICPARRPARNRCEFFRHAAEAERAGFRACFRCRPELAPGNASVDAAGELVRAAMRRIDAGYLDEHSVDELGATLGVTGRHLRRTMETELGVSPVELAQTRRLALAKQLLHDTNLPLTQVALAAGFGSIRRFNALFQQRFGRAPSGVRRGHGPAPAAATGQLTVRLDYRPPLDWQALLTFLASRAIPGVERVEGRAYQRVAAIGEHAGLVEVKADARRPILWASVDVTLSQQLGTIVSRLRALFDLDARPDVIAEHLSAAGGLNDSPSRHRGLRVPGAFDSFELAVRAILGQQVSVRGATTIAGRFARRFGRPLAEDQPAWLRFPDAETIAACDVAAVQTIGVPRARATTIVELARALRTGAVDLERGADPQQAIAQLQQLRGIGPWTANYIAMRALSWPDAFLAEDLIIRRHLKQQATNPAQLATRWHPWRAYAVMHIWDSTTRGQP